jgi:hypothetical protein
MPSIVGPNVINEIGLVFSFDTGDTRNSYLGEPTTNLLPNPPINALPTYGNGWSTYNTNQYCGNNGCAVYWTIPAIASVSNNIVTTVSAHQIRSFDVINPQTTGGGVTAGTNYVAKKISDTQFSLHAYNSSQDGSQGYINPVTNGFKVHDSYWLDERVSINASGFPTNWWGAPHLPNSAIVKEIIPDGFDVNRAQPTDCIRLHWFRSDATDGMAYGVDAALTIGQPVTTSFYVRAASASAVGQYIAFQHYNYGGVAGASGFYMNAYTGALGEWVRSSFTFTPTHSAVISYWFPSSANMKIDVANIQIEHKPHATPFTISSRSATNSLKDLTGNQTIDLNTVSFNSSGALVFDGTDDRIDLGSLSDYFVPGVAAITVESVFKITPGASGNPGPLFENYRFNVWYQYSNDKIYFGVRTGSPETAGYQMAVEMESTIACSAKDNFNYVVAVYETTGPTQGRLKLYLNGQFAGQADGLKIGSYPLYPTWIGQSYHGGYGTFKLNGQVTLTKMYTRALQQSEVENNYRNLKGRFNLA